MLVKKNIKILIVDDDRITLGIQSKILSYKGYEVFVRDNASDIFNTFEEYHPDIILLDQHLPFVSGSAAIRLLRSQMLSRPIPIIYFSLHENFAEQAKSAGADLYLSKACTTDQLMDCIDSLVNDTVC